MITVDKGCLETSNSKNLKECLATRNVKMNSWETVQKQSTLKRELRDSPKTVNFEKDSWGWAFFLAQKKSKS